MKAKLFSPVATRYDDMLGSVQATGQAAPSGAPPWTVRPSYTQPGVIVWGTLKPDGSDAFPALSHELGHALYGPTWGH